MEKIIHIAFGLHDPTGTYSKYTAAAIASVFENTSEKITVHLLTDRLLSSKNRNRFEELARQYGQTIVLYDIEIKEKFENVRGLRRVTKGTLYRLKIPELLSADIDKVIYLDSDILVNLDVRELWDIDFDGKAILAVKDFDTRTAVKGKLVETGILDVENYYNAGVMVWNLDKIRSCYDIYNQAVAFFNEYGEYCDGFTDQHASNAIFKGDIKFIDNKYNYFTRYIRNTGQTLKNIIYHLTSERPRMEMSEEFDKLFYETLSRTPWGSMYETAEYMACGIRARYEQLSFYRKMLKNSRGRKYIFWGAGSRYLKYISGCFNINTYTDYCIDSNEKLIGTKSYGMNVYPVEKLDEEDKKNIYIVVASKLYYNEIAEQLKDKGFEENIDFIDGLKLLNEDEEIIYVR